MENHNKTLVVINFKQVKGESALSIAKLLNEIEFDCKQRFQIVLCIGLEDVEIVSNNVSLPVFIQDTYSDTKFQDLHLNDDLLILNKNIKGVLLNHPENKVCKEDMKRCIEIAESNFLKVIIGATSIKEAIFIDEEYKPDIIAFEDCSLIGTNNSIVEKSPETIIELVGKLHAKVIVGGGVSTNMDLCKVVECGGDGILISSNIIKANNPLKALQELINIPLYIKSI